MSRFRGYETHKFQVEYEKRGAYSDWQSGMNVFNLRGPAEKELARLTHIAGAFPDRLRNVRLVEKNGKLPVYY